MRNSVPLQVKIATAVLLENSCVLRDDRFSFIEKSECTNEREAATGCLPLAAAARRPSFAYVGLGCHLFKNLTT